MKTRNQLKDRELGHYWEAKFAEVIIPFGFSSDSETGGIVDDKIIWGTDGQPVYVQIRHKDTYWLGKTLRHCYGYEKYRIEKDVALIDKQRLSSIYVIHDYTHFGRDSRVNRLEDWYAQSISYLYKNIDHKQDGPTYYGDNYKIMTIYYWQAPKFKPLADVLIKLREGQKEHW